MIHHNPALSGPYSTGSPRSTSIRVSEGFEVERSSPLSSQPRLPSVKRGLGSVDPLEVGLQTHLPPLLAAKARPFTVSGLIPFDPASLVVFFRSKVGREATRKIETAHAKRIRHVSSFFFLRASSHILLISRSISIMISRQPSMFSWPHADPMLRSLTNTPRHAKPSSTHPIYRYPPPSKSRTIRSSRRSETHSSRHFLKVIISPLLEICWKSCQRAGG